MGSSILVVDDEPQVRQVFCEILTARGYSVMEAANGEAALEAVAKFRPRLVLSDVEMPGLSGLDLCRRIKLDPASSHTTVVLVSGKAVDSQFKANGFELGADDYLVKPVPPEELVARIAMLLRLNETSEALRSSEQHYREAEAKYKSIFEHATEGIFQSTPAGKYLSANHALARMFGYDSPQALIHQVSDIARDTYVIPERRGELKRLLEAQGTLKGFEAERYRKDRSRFWISINAHVVRDAGGAILFYEGTNQDITERKRAEVELRASEEKFRALFESAPIGIGLHGADGRIVQTNHAYQRMVGYSDEELRQIGIRRLTHPDDVAEGQNLFGQLRDGKRDRYQRDKRYLHKDGRIIWGQVAASTLRNERGELAYIISMVQDVTEQKRVTEALQRSERNLRLISENSRDVIFAFNMEREPIYVNPAVEELTGYSFLDIQHQKFVNWIHPEDQPRMLSLWDNLFIGKSYADVEFRLITKSGVERWCSSTWGPVFDESGKQVGVQGRERDITERKQLEKEILEISANERRRVGHELHDGLGQFLAGIAFKTKALEQNLRKENSSYADTVKELVSLISNAISQARNLARGLDPIEVETIGLCAALQNLAVETCKLFNLECDFICEDHNLSVSPQTALALYRIVQEAIHNATTHGDAKSIRIALEKKNEHLILTVSDNGAGFDPQQATIGSGMGLRVMRYRARSIRGDLKINSEPGRGTDLLCSVPWGGAQAAVRGNGS